jgi:hypothetical protein
MATPAPKVPTPPEPTDPPGPPLGVLAYQALCIAFGELGDEQRLALASASGWLEAALSKLETDPEHAAELIRAAQRNVRRVAGMRGTS